MKKRKSAHTGFPTDKKVVPRQEVKAPDVDTALLQYVRACYTIERSRWESLKEGKQVNYTPPQRYDGMRAVTVENELELEPARSSVWQKVIDWCGSREIDPAEYIRICFTHLPMINTAPEPQQLLGAKYESRWHETWEHMEEQLALDLKLQKQIARTNIIVQQTVSGETPEDAQLLVITDGDLSLSPLFRYCLATSINTKKMREVATIFQAEAVLQFECYRRLYKRLWKEILPEGFSKMSRRLYPHALATMGLQMVERREHSDE